MDVVTMIQTKIIPQRFKLMYLHTIIQLSKLQSFPLKVAEFSLKSYNKQQKNGNMRNLVILSSCLMNAAVKCYIMFIIFNFSSLCIITSTSYNLNQSLGGKQSRIVKVNLSKSNHETN